MYALVDCNNFYVSCERVFRPDLEGKPVLVLSNNDGCVIARSNEVKKLGITMAQPYFQIKDLVKQFKIQVFSSNYALYGDMSKRIMQSLSVLAPKLENYSIDEAFLDLHGFKIDDLYAYAHTLKKTIKQWTGIPTSVGIGATKTLAKVANAMGKKGDGLCVLIPEIVPFILSQILVGELWGIGRRWAAQLNALNIYNAEELRQQNISAIKKKFGVVLARTVAELNGQSCRAFSLEVEDKKQIISSRSFGKSVESFLELRQSLAYHISRAAEKMRAQGSVTTAFQVWVYGCQKGTEGRTAESELVKLPIPMQHTAQLLAYGEAALKKIFRNNWRYKKLGVVFLDMVPNFESQLDFFDQDSDRSSLLMKSLDGINQRYGKGSLRFAAEGFDKPWSMKRDRSSPAYTTQWTDLPRAFTS